MTIATPALTRAIKDRFAHVDSCPFSGPRIFFENAGGALTLNSVVETSAKFAAIPDNQGRDNPASHGLVAVIKRAKADMALFFNAPDGQFFVGESGTELTFRLIRTAIMGTPAGGKVIGSSVEHPASRSAALHWAGVAGKEYINVAHDNATGRVTAQAYAAAMTPEVQVATILHTSPVTGIANDVPAIVSAIRKVAPEAFIIVDGIQHASHGRIDIASYDIDGYVVSPYKVFSRHGYGVAWASDRLTALPIETLKNGPAGNWEMGTRDTGAYATFTDVVSYFDWLGGETSDATDPRARIEAAGVAIHAHEKSLTDAMLKGADNLPGLADLPGVTIVGGLDNPDREGLVSFALDHVPAAAIVERLNAQGIRTHVRRADHYSGNILDPLGLEAAVRVSLCHYNTHEEVRSLLAAMKDIAG
ncbi:aminotransferase class V-fold PLP-dependent enzyme [Sulfitobacter sp. M57]|uniref:aminotransferase class V-fold PLP-dependent enzyme n=1 Tax=unclassified Sulfitobacter TaxID=196795 RepID=UPI0023E1AD0B|nr:MULTISPECIES: aminotransferase class V-fold PLP-dependent enzyme [unclassified Sulfitobacter]MDF3415142.1 aminotransferase class V-fold PLP-dependent enzyme [Sulfitobacter sp. KE5]MDF3422623.1 aminotransferase class V-fold PLP-dependent enzyme [Sulfitobacter sp. KE43]MDF3433688.1 aminotransferase class V-fold PLP-dependent enzyme [Sulfitobacter sp. KE42]MDF3459328.1 aminotransferase class V-fold PLP-dependent enzyme [Sulfitobacter sp. S74]MDF3463227.1 aminotransferase class V-fold PLP-depen